MDTKHDAIFKLEQQILACWTVVDDVEMVTKHFVDSPDWQDMDPALCDALINKYFAIKDLYQLKFDVLFQTFDELCKEYHHLKRYAESMDVLNHKEWE